MYYFNDEIIPNSNEKVKKNEFIRYWLTLMKLWWKGENKKSHYPSWPETPDHTYRILINGGYGSGKTNALYNFISHQPDIKQTSYT